MKKTKIVSTLGPASTDVDTIVKLINAGANIFRFNFSHGDHPEHLGRMENVKKAEEITGKHVGLMLDTKGAEIRTTVQKEGKINYEIGDKVRISMDPSIEGTHDKIAVTYPGLYDDTHVGGHVLFDDGLIDMLIDEKDEEHKELVCHVLNHGVLGSRKGVNAPGVSINLPGITEKDSSDIRFGLDNKINYISASFVRKAQDVLDIRELLKEKNMEDVQIFPKIESQEGIDNFEEIIEVSDGLMVPRGDMGVEIPAENVPIVQKHMIKRCNELGKPVITATQMLDSMQETGESANGDYPVKSVAMMNAIDIKAENHLWEFGTETFDWDKSDVTETIGSAVANAAKDLDIHTIVAYTASGYTAKMISKYRPNADIVALTPNERVERGLMINWGVQPYVVDEMSNTDKMFDLAAKKAVELGFAKKGDKIIVVAGVPLGVKGATNMMRIKTID